MHKPKVGFFGITGCAGCLLSVIFNEDEILQIAEAVDIVAFPFIKSKNSEGKLDMAFIEGTVVSKDDLDVVKKIRKRSKAVVALGTCACEGNIPALRNFTDEKELDYLRYKKNRQNQGLGDPKPIHKVIKVEASLPGCPPDRDEIKKFIKYALVGKEFRSYKSAVCIDCKLNENNCLLDDNIICLGPISNGGCNSVCPNAGFRCYGCRGINVDANFDEFFDLMMRKGFSKDEIRKALDTFMAIAVDDKLKGTKWER